MCGPDLERIAPFDPPNVNAMISPIAKSSGVRKTIAPHKCILPSPVDFNGVKVYIDYIKKQSPQIGMDSEFWAAALESVSDQVVASVCKLGFQLKGLGPIHCFCRELVHPHEACDCEFVAVCHCEHLLG